MDRAVETESRVCRLVSLADVRRRAKPAGSLLLASLLVQEARGMWAKLSQHGDMQTPCAKTCRSFLLVSATGLFVILSGVAGEGTPADCRSGVCKAVLCLGRHRHISVTLDKYSMT